MLPTIRRALDAEARLAISAHDVGPDADLYRLGLTPYSAIRLLLALERELHVEVPRRLLTRETTRSIASLARALQDAEEAVAQSRAA